MTLGKDLAPHLPFLRRYARALAGSQRIGDALVRTALETIVADPGRFPRDVDLRMGLYAALMGQWDLKRERDLHRESEGLASIDSRPRQALLLTEMEGFTPEDAGYLMGCDRNEVERLAAEACSEIERQPPIDVLIIEDEPMIAMDLEQLVTDLGHRVTDIAVTHEEAVATARAMRPGLVLADIRLADESSGIEAVQEILQEFSLPVIFITAYPERLLTGERPEPAFLITKPFQPSTIKAAIGQALYFRRTMTNA
ncbi:MULTISPECIES: response regulator [unclassified Sphingomonas]|uniref:response regulator n=1 Tax=unclassified Sphingomonas TaxID=196159 RepID=UPI0006F7C71C|nr:MULTISPECIES: response regulator [unclassified Sphingomonas]KQX18541.1 Phyllosphere-induced regulator PhyR [Sphingomonas sp. Root1294]KQY72135.1 Phyllosphere-induced regulator PhyR [Sphingomonas sp. Root50]KRB94592.1 Phyllosphere-induced regulator PhyR [Sphingomonas sp. Root720]